jgi:hypothetical protein
MAWKLDRARSFSEIWSPGGISGFLQEGIEFDAKGEPLPGQFPSARPPKATPGRAPAGSLVIPAAPLPSSPPAGGYAAMDDDTLRGLIEVRGDEWKGRTAAIAALEEPE